MGGGGSAGGGDTSNEIRYAPYIEAHHQTFLNNMATEVAAAIHNSPFAGYVPIDYLSGFFGVGYALSSFPSLYDMYGKFMAGLDIDALYSQILEDSINNPAIDNLVSAHAQELSDDIVQNASPRLVTGLRDINSVVSSSFVVSKAMLETARTRAISKYDSGLRYAMIPVAAQRWSDHLKWNKDVIITYAEIMKLYFASAMDLDNHNYSMTTKDILWPFTVLDFQRTALGAMQGAMNNKGEVAGASQTQKAIGGALSGAAAGAMIGASTGATYGGWYGAAIGAVVGLGSAFL